MRKGKRSAKSRVEMPEAASAAVPPRFGLWRPHAWRIVALWILSLVAYSNSFQSGFVFDNRTLILEDARVHAATGQNIGRILTGDYWPDREASGLYRPLATLSYLMNYAILGNGPHPEGYHWFNFVLHGFNVALVYALGLMIFASPAPAFALAGIWGVHPLLTESVTNIIGRADLLAGIGVLAGLLCYMKGQAEQRRHKFAWLAGLTAAQVLGLFSKENAIILIALMLLTDVAWPPRSQKIQRLPFYLAAALPCAVFLFVRARSYAHMQVLFIDNPLVGAGFWTARLTAIKVIGKYLGLFVWPASLSPDYSFNAISVFSWRLTEWEDVKTVLAALVCVGGILLAIRWRRTQRTLFFFVVFFFLTLLPTANLTILIGSIMAERFAYLPFVGLAGCLVVAIQAGAVKLSRKWSSAPQAAWIAIGLVCLAFATRTYARNADWQDDGSLWTHAVEVCPQSAKAHVNLGRVFLEAPGRLPEAIAEYETALRIEPDYALAHYSLGTAMSKSSGRLDSAIEHYRAALRIEPNYPQAHNNLGTALAQKGGQLQEAIAEFRAALRLDPNYAEAHINLGDALASTPGGVSEAIAEYSAALRIAPDLAIAHYDLASTLAEIPGRLADAIAEFRRAIKAKPDFPSAHNNLGICLAQLPGGLSEAIVEFESAIRDDPGYADAHLNLGRALSQIPGRNQDAIRELETALRMQPDPNIAKILEQVRANAK
jgi:tetratricopeptide (TPR) repeat protein